VELTRTSIEDLGLNVLVFPEGTRSTRLGPGRTGLVQVAQFLGAPIVPVGCNGSDKAYPGNAPISRGGRIVYRVGEPLGVDHPELAPYRTQADVTPFSGEASARYGAQYQAITEIVMERINELLDPEYRYSEEGPGGSQGVSRFV
jgi:1-acyl-sn-glycerol-3-phosphate acyltransferase